LLSDIGIGIMIGLLGYFSSIIGIPLMLCIYGAPMLVVNMWLVGYTWLQHTDVDVPHLPAEDFSYVKGAFHSIDRPYDKLLWGIVDFLHHHIGTTHGKIFSHDGFRVIDNG
jgi:omega-6 fatty acid desaturase (delta-12 desaturase)